MHNDSFDNVSSGSNTPESPYTLSVSSDEHTFVDSIDNYNIETAAMYICQVYESISHIDIDDAQKRSESIKLYVKYSNKSPLHYYSRNIRTDITFDDIIQADNSHKADLLVARCWEVLRKVERSLSPTDIELFGHKIVRSDINTFVCSTCDATHSFDNKLSDIRHYDHDERQLMLRYLLGQFSKEPCWWSIPDSLR